MGDATSTRQFSSHIWMHWAVVLVLFGVCGTSSLRECRGATGLIIQQTDQTGAQTQLDRNHSYTWSFSSTSTVGFDPIVSVFTLKTGPHTSDPAVLRLYEADANFASNNVVASAAMTPQQASQQYEPVTFTLFEGGPTVLSGNYNLTLESNAADEQNQAWFIKGDTSNDALTFTHMDGTAVDGFTAGQTTDSTAPTATPEPSFVALFVLAAVGGMGYFGVREIQQRRRAVAWGM